LIHEAGHQVAHIVGWNEELAAALETQLQGVPPEIAALWASWASEIAADTFAFMHTGYGSVVALHDVLAGEETTVFRVTRGDPHPMGYLRVLLGVEMCRYFYQSGPWDELAQVWIAQYPLEMVDARISAVVRHSLPFLPQVVRIAADT